ncbi:MAG: twin-arginine translocase TatA/TatE family subunit [Rhizomicrobium sp.]|jgi:sec-independent protein translocase protein TatA
MGGLSIWHILLLALIVMVLFGGRGKISEFMGDFAKGIKSFKKGLADEEASPPPPPPRTIDVDHRDETTTPNKDTTTRS